MISTIIVIAYVVVKHFMSNCVDVYAKTVVISTFDDCDILDKVIHITGNVYNDLVVTIKVRKDETSLCKVSLLQLF